MLNINPFNLKINVLWLLTAVVVSISAGIFIGRITKVRVTPALETTPHERIDMFEIREGGFRFINPLWDCDCAKPSGLHSIVEMEAELKNYISLAIQQQKAEHISIYYRDLNNGPWMGIGENENYSPASLLKVPVLIAALKKAEREPAFLQKKILFKKPLVNIPVNMSDSVMLKPGTRYKLAELLNHMIANSDNDAKELVMQNIGDKLFYEVMDHIGIDIRNKQAGDDYISVKTYASLFRLLYNATYLNREMSEMALNMLSQTTFRKGLVAKLPSDVFVSHKFGERAYNNADIKQLHDCGIVYSRNSPYLLCIMTKGKDFNQLGNIIADLSSIVYLTVERQIQ